MKVVTKPALFFENMPSGTWQEDALSFSLVTGWILSFAVTFAFFVNNYIPTGISLIEGIAGRKLVIALPVLVVMGIIFFTMTLLIIAGIMIAAILCLFVTCAGLLNFLLMLLGGRGNLLDVIKASLYASCAVLAGVINVFLMIAVKYKMMSVGAWITGEKVVFYLTSIFLFYVFGIMGARVHKEPTWKSFLAATVPLILLVLFNIVFSSRILPKVAMLLG
jgi:hypothetical protein